MNTDSFYQGQYLTTPPDPGETVGHSACVELCGGDWVTVRLTNSPSVDPKDRIKTYRKNDPKWPHLRTALMGRVAK